jgi:hypothetical protein
MVSMLAKVSWVESWQRAMDFLGGTKTTAWLHS